MKMLVKLVVLVAVLGVGGVAAYSWFVMSDKDQTALIDSAKKGDVGAVTTKVKKAADRGIDMSKKRANYELKKASDDAVDMAVDKAVDEAKQAGADAKKKKNSKMDEAAE